MGILLVFFFVPGYLISRHFLPVQYKAMFDSGHRQYFRIVDYSFRAFLLSTSIIFLLKSTEVGRELIIFYDTILDSVIPFESSVVGLKEGIFKFCTLNLMISYSMTFLAKTASDLAGQNVVMKFYKDVVSDNEIEKLLLESLIRAYPICVNMKSGKVYVGTVMRTQFKDPDRKYFAILPIMSGFRTEDKKLIEFTTYYADSYQKIEKIGIEIKQMDFLMVFPITEVASLYLFNIEAYSKVFSLSNVGTIEVVPD